MAASALDFNHPETAHTVGTELAQTTMALADKLALSVVIHTPADLEQAVLDRQQLGATIRRVEEFFEPFVSMAYKLHKSLCSRRAELLAPLQKVDTAKADAIRDFKAAQDRLREAEERRLADERRREDEARAAAEAAQLEAQGEPEMAAAVLQEAIAAPAPVVTLPDTTAASGAKFRRRWAWKYAGGPRAIAGTPPALVQRTLQLIPREFLCVDEAKVGAYVRSMKTSARIPGIDIFYVDDPVR